MPTSGERRLRSTSTASAFSGETYSTRHARIGSASGSASEPVSEPAPEWASESGVCGRDGLPGVSPAARACSRSSAQRKADSVFPEPVGATTSVCSPELMALQAAACAGVGAANAPVNQARVAGEKRSSTLDAAAEPDVVGDSIAADLLSPEERNSPARRTARGRRTEGGTDGGDTGVASRDQPAIRHRQDRRQPADLAFHRVLRSGRRCRAPSGSLG